MCNGVYTLPNDTTTFRICGGYRSKKANEQWNSHNIKQNNSYGV